MVSLKWGDVLSTLLPGSVALFAIARYFPLLHEQMLHLNDIEIGSGLALLIAAALVGGLLEAVTYHLGGYCQVEQNQGSGEFSRSMPQWSLAYQLE